jgi:plastocyanin
MITVHNPLPEVTSLTLIYIRIYFEMATISVAVGNGSYVFSPNSIKANVGDIVEFDFFPKVTSFTPYSHAS